MGDYLLHSGDEPVGLLFRRQRLIRFEAAVVCLRELLTYHRLVESHDRGQQHGVGDAVGDVVFAAQRIAEGMHRGGAAGCDGDAGKEAGDQHLLLGFQRVPVVAGGHDVLHDHLECPQREAVANGVRLVGGEALHRVAESIHSRGGGYGPGQVLCCPAVQYDIIRDHLRIDYADLEFLLGHRYYGVGRGFRSGSGRSGHADDLYGLVRCERVIQQVFYGDAAVYEQAHQLGGVYDASSSDCDQHVGFQFVASVHDALHFGVCGLHCQIVQDRGFAAFTRDHIDHKIKKSCLSDAFRGEQHRMSGAVRSDDVGYL